MENDPRQDYEYSYFCMHMNAVKVPKQILARQHEIVAEFIREVNKHVEDIAAGRATEMLEIRDFAQLMHIHPTHLSNTIKLTTGQAPCFFFEEKIMEVSRRLLSASNEPIANIAMQLTYDPSNFTKFFKRFQGVTPKQYREQLYREKTEVVTI
jgi:AraC family transcriptional regulator, regulatory protein of adaptative response / methylphosphotriester-DNA alkyltransferase methyltransferase